MTEKVHFVRQDGLPVPLIYLSSPEDLALWYADGLRRALDHGERELSITCYDTQRAFGFETARAAREVLRAVTGLLYGRPEAERLTILCADEESWRAYRFCWNMWYAERKLEQG